MSSVIIIGGGAAGMMAAIIAARNGHTVTLMEKNEKPGKKLFITGKGRCNFTNAGDEEDIRQSVVTNPKFMYSAFKGFSNYDVMGFFDELGLKFKIERGNRCFPESDHSSDVISALVREMRKLKVNIMLNTEVLDVLTEDIEDGTKRFGGVEYKETTSDKKRLLKADSCIIATGGNSYSSTGSTGDGYRFARNMSHTVTPVIPALVPLTIREEWASELMGLSLRNISISILDNKKEVYSDFGEMLFTHFGVSGPVILSASSYTTAILRKRPLKLIVDLKPALSEEQLDERILRDFSEEKNKAYKNSLDKLPSNYYSYNKFIFDINKDKKVNEITKQERQGLVHLIKNLEMTVTGTRGFNEAIITQGGVNVKEINPSTMESKLVQNVYFAGEVLDVDAVTGGFNLQVAWSSAYAAASHLE
jgi:predicted Rossmann fold flavoprotein